MYTVCLFNDKIKFLDELTTDGSEIRFDALKETYVDMVEAGIIDPVKVTRSALQNATSVASTLLNRLFCGRDGRPGHRTDYVFHLQEKVRRTDPDRSGELPHEYTHQAGYRRYQENGMVVCRHDIRRAYRGLLPAMV